jgi:hypothetical protein
LFGRDQFGADPDVAGFKLRGSESSLLVPLGLACRGNLVKIVVNYL